MRNYIRMLIGSSFFCKRRFGLIAFMLPIILLFGCDLHTVISVDEKLPPNFKFTGTGTLPFFIIMDLGEADKESEVKYTTLWKITPDSAKAGTVPLGPITYGIVPTGWTQTVPAQGSPPPLVEGHVYHAGGPEMEMPDGVVKFRIRSGKVVRF